jgi:hypothetical protein
MIAIAAVAVMIGVLRLLALRAGVTGVALSFRKSDLWLVIDEASNKSGASRPGGSMYFWRVTHYIPLKNVAAVAAVLVAIWAVASCYRCRQRQKGKSRTQPTGECEPPDQTIARPEPVQSGEAERV